jgi:hypothetical protein
LPDSFPQVIEISEQKRANPAWIYAVWVTSTTKAHISLKPRYICRELQGAEPPVNISQHFKIPFTNGPISFDLLAGKVVPSGGDVTITVNRPNGQISEQDPQKMEHQSRNSNWRLY